MQDARLEDLPYEECLRLLRERSIGRIAVVVNDLPIVLPVNYRLVETSGPTWVALRTRPGNVIERARMNVAFEIDSIDVLHEQGWSVLVRGTLRHVDPDAAGAPIPFRSVKPPAVSRSVTPPAIAKERNCPCGRTGSVRESLNDGGGTCRMCGSSTSPPEECLRLLRESSVGRIAVVVDDFPIVLPVNFRLVETNALTWVALRTRPGNVIERRPRMWRSRSTASIRCTSRAGRYSCAARSIMWTPTLRTSGSDSTQNRGFSRSVTRGSRHQWPPVARRGIRVGVQPSRLRLNAQRARDSARLLLPSSILHSMMNHGASMIGAKNPEQRTIASGEARDACATVGSALTADPGAAPSSTTFHDEEGGARWVQESDQVKGQAKEAVGSLTGDKDLESEGKADRRAGEAKEKLDDAKGKIEDVIDKAKDTLHREQSVDSLSSGSVRVGWGGWLTN